jgi:hypothetical protein
VTYSDCCVSLLPEEYGKVVDWDYVKVHRWDICAFPRAEIVFQAQKTLLRFLRHIVQGLLEDCTAKPTNLKWLELADNGFRGTVSSESVVVVFYQR